MKDRTALVRAALEEKGRRRGRVRNLVKPIDPRPSERRFSQYLRRLSASDPSASTTDRGLYHAAARWDQHRARRGRNNVPGNENRAPAPQALLRVGYSGDYQDWFTGDKRNAGQRVLRKLRNRRARAN